LFGTRQLHQNRLTHNKRRNTSLIGGVSVVSSDVPVSTSAFTLSLLSPSSSSLSSLSFNFCCCKDRFRMWVHLQRQEPPIALTQNSNTIHNTHTHTHTHTLSHSLSHPNKEISCPSWWPHAQHYGKEAPAVSWAGNLEIRLRVYPVGSGRDDPSTTRLGLRVLRGACKHERELHLLM